MTAFLAIIGIVVIILAMVWLLRLERKSPINRACTLCGSRASYGYSQRAESFTREIQSMCRDHLIAHLESDFREYAAKAVVIQPVPGPPCYVFHPIEGWSRNFPDTLIARDATTLLAGMKAICESCSADARFVWVEAEGISADNSEELLQKGIATLSSGGDPEPISLCARCCVDKIRRSLEEEQIEYLEVCGPRDKNGFMIPMTY